MKIKMLTRAVPMNRNIHEEARSQAEVTRLIYLGEPGEGFTAGLWEMSPCPCLWDFIRWREGSHGKAWRRLPLPLATWLYSAQGSGHWLKWNRRTKRWTYHGLQEDREALALVFRGKGKKNHRLAFVPLKPGWPFYSVARPYLNLEQNLGL